MLRTTVLLAITASFQTTAHLPATSPLVTTLSWQGMVAVHQFVSVGNHAFVTGGSLVRKDIPPFVKAAREPIAYVGINSVGLRRRGFDSEKIREIQDIYRIIFQKNYNTTQALEIIEGDFEATKRT